MKTEEIKRTPKSAAPDEVSRALQELTPLSCVIVDRRGLPVPLSSAGYVLRLDRPYRLRIRTPFPDEDVASVRIISPPSFVTLEPEMREIDEQGRSVRTIPFTVSVGWIPQMLKLNLGIFSDDLEISYHFQPGVFRQPPIFVCPIVARPVWTVAIMALLAGLFWVLVQKILMDFMNPEHRVETMRLFLESLVRLDSWLWLIGVAVPVWLLVTLVNSIALYRRSRELEGAFQEQFPII
jgi:hypothetical protein